MAYVGILGVSGAIAALLWGTFAVVVSRHVRFRRAVATLEWAALTPGFGPNSQIKFGLQRFGQSIQLTRKTWNECEHVFALSYSRYILGLLDSSPRTLYWANRFGSELRQLARPLAAEMILREDATEYWANLAQHVMDFTEQMSDLVRSIVGRRSDQVG